MKLEAQPSIPSLYFLLISRNKVKIIFLCLFPVLSVQYKNIPKIKVLRMTCQFNMIFSGIFEDLLCKNYHGGSCQLVTRVEGAPYPQARPPASWAHGGPPPLIPAPIFFLCLTQTRKINSSTSSSPRCCDFQSLAQSTSRKTAWGDCSLVCDSSIGPISFCSSALFIANLCCIGDHVLELACQIYVVPSSSNA